MEDTLQSFENEIDDSFSMLYSSWDMTKLDKIDEAADVAFMIGKLGDVCVKYESQGRKMAMALDLQQVKHSEEIAALEAKLAEAMTQMRDAIHKKTREMDAKSTECDNLANKTSTLNDFILSLRGNIDAFIDNMNAQEVQQEMEIVTVYESEEDARSEHGKDNGNSNPAVEQNLVNPEHAIENVAVDAVDVAVQVVEPPPEDMDARTAEKENACPQSTPIGSKGNASTSSVSVNPLASISVLAENHGDNKPSTQSGNILVLCPYCDMLFGKKASYRLHLTKEHMLRKKKVPGKFVKKRKRDDTEDEEDVNDQGDEGAVEDTGSNSQGDDNVVGAYVMMPMKNAMKRRKKNAALYYCK